MQHLADLLATIPLPADDTVEHSANALTRLPDGPFRLGCDAALVQDLGADLPAGHLHVWGGPSGAGKTAFLLSLLHAAAARGRRVAYATYDLAPDSLALRMLAMAAGVKLDALPDPGGAEDQCALPLDDLRRVRAARAALSRLPFSFLPARGFSVESIRDRLVRMPFRAEVLAVDYLQGVIREPGTDMGVSLRALSDMATNLPVAVICAVRPQDDSLDGGRAVRSSLSSASDVSDRVGWITPVEDGPVRRAEVMHNRHGASLAMPLELDETSGSLERAHPE